MCLIGGSLIPETHAPVILRRRAKLLSASTGKSYVSAYDINARSYGGAVASVSTYFTRPFVLLFRELIVFLFALYAAIIYGILYLMFGCYPVVFVQDRGFTYGQAGLPFIAVGVGMLFGMAGTIFTSIQYGQRQAKSDTPLPPEERLRGACVGGIVSPLRFYHL